MTGELRLVRPDASMAEEISAFRRDMLEAGSEFDGCGPLRRMEAAEWLDFIRRLADPATVPERWVLDTQFVCLRGTRIVGTIDVRHVLNDYLRDYAGHIGYSVRPADRRQGIATFMLATVLPYCRQIGLNRVMIACEPDNPASRRTILKNGGVYARTVHEPRGNVDLEQYWITL